jgi:NAD(P)-dependent dehydrogenase (short-subunit alcohol dehydrogenase family)
MSRIVDIGGLRVVLTGAAGSIAPFVGKAFLQGAARVLLADLAEERLEQVWLDLSAWVGQCERHVVDVRSEESVRGLFEKALRLWGGVDVLITCAAYLDQPRPAWEIPLSDWQACLDVDLTGTFLCCREALRHMIQQRRGTIINISSIAGKIAYPLRASYAVAKAGVHALTRCLAREAAPHGVTVNAICPGPTESPRIRRVIQERAAATGRTETEVEQEYLQKTAMGEFVRPEEVAALAVFLASPAARHITGQLIDIDSGYLLT